MNEQTLPDLQPPRFETGGRHLIAGFGGRFTVDTIAGIPALWDAFIPHIGKVPGQVGGVTYGACCNPDGKGGFDYIAGVEVQSLDGLPAEFRTLELLPLRYAVFRHVGPIATLHHTVTSIWNKWLPASGMESACAPDFERYSEDYDPVTGEGLLEIWLPVKERAGAQH
ncbi:GyrI-like domain-containing protein [Cupriavidus sp. CV2]|uniref:GyrI-like domain-containing protein n=1 Tax=Cupriavidus TaxID=106589 RepID=UPI00296AC26B|nr:GyrI-like domain-containing protein [Cupriavidus sp. CV2]MDW3682530.1 GyrI-like domain-containing protein [Cupriavidus sp. CV2]